MILVPCSVNYTFCLQGKFIRIHFGTTGKLASADIETCKIPASASYLERFDERTNCIPALLPCLQIC